MNSKTPQDHKTESIKDRVFNEIAKTGVEPRSRYVYLCQNWLVWGLWGVSIIFGALAVAVLLFVSSYRYYDMYEATHDNFATFLLDALPYIWFVIFAAMLLLAMWQLKRTRRGYRLSATVLGVSSFMFSIMLGGLFHLGGFGWSLDTWLGKTAPMYASQAEMEQKMWQNPSEGRLIGRQVESVIQSTSTVLFVDTAGFEWAVYSIDLSQTDKEYLQRGEKVRLLGLSANKDQFAHFHACGVFPWMIDKQMEMIQLNRERKLFVDRMYGHYQTANKRRLEIDAVLTDPESVETETSPCHALAAVRRVHQGMQQ